MLRIRRIYDDVLPLNREALKQVKEILLSRFPDADREDIEKLGNKLRNPFKQRFRTILFVAESLRGGRVKGFAILLHEPENQFAYLDWIATSSVRPGGGVGAALYDRVRREARALDVIGLFFECLPDDVENCADERLLKDNRARLRFYERWGARPIIGTDYELPISPDDTCMPHLVYDGLDSTQPLGRKAARAVVRAVLERKYAGYCSPEYVNKVVKSFRDDPVRLRDFRYVKPEVVKTAVENRSDELIALIVNDRHDIHHVHERGYVESPVRVSRILAELEPSGLFTQIPPRQFPDRHIHAVHDADFVSYLERACAQVPKGKSLYPYIFPIRNNMRPPKELSVLSGYYCIDTFTPINANAYLAARRSVDCALTAAREILDGRRIAYALIRPPGHHAERRSFGGFCYFNNSAIAAHYLSAYGKVALLDIDYHHGNGGQDIFYRRSDVLTVSIHGHPSIAYPYFCGFEEERGEGAGEGFNMNIPLPEVVNGDTYQKTLKRALRRIEDFKPNFLVVSVGFDPAKGDPTGTWTLGAKDFTANGRLVGSAGLPTVVVQEGGYRTQTLGRNALRFFQGLAEGAQQWSNERYAARERMHGVTFRNAPDADDIERVRHLVDLTGFFSSDEVLVAAELVEERLSKGKESGYEFIMADHYGRLIGYACFGLIPCTISSYDLYWIAVHPDYQGRGLGQRLMKEVETRIKESNGTRIYLDTSQRVQYASTRAFYDNCGYRVESVLEDFYGPGDGKVVFCKSLV